MGRDFLKNIDMEKVLREGAKAAGVGLGAAFGGPLGASLGGQAGAVAGDIVLGPEGEAGEAGPQAVPPQFPAGAGGSQGLRGGKFQEPIGINAPEILASSPDVTGSGTATAASTTGAAKKGGLFGLPFNLDSAQQDVLGKSISVLAAAFRPQQQAGPPPGNINFPNLPAQDVPRFDFPSAPGLMSVPNITGANLSNVDISSLRRLLTGRRFGG